MSEDLCLPETGQNVGAAIGLVAAAGMASSLGGAITFFLPHKYERVNLYLAASLAVASGVMLYVSFAEIFTVKAVEGFRLCMDNEGLAYLYATLCFFGGVLLCWGLDAVLHLVEHYLMKGVERKEKEKAEAEKMEAELAADVEGGVPDEDEAASEDDGEDNVPSMAAVMGTNEMEDEKIDEEKITEHMEKEDHKMHLGEEIMHEGQMVAAIYNYEDAMSHDQTDKERRRLARMGLFAAIAIAFHNFPEGLATFVATLSDPSVGISVAIAIGIHNIPEGMCVAVPIYYATGSRWKAFFWATLSGVTELIGALLGLIILAQIFTQIAYGVLFGLVAGMMVYISLAELLPTAHKYDPETRVVTIGLVSGMAVMALSLVLFQDFS